MIMIRAVITRSQSGTNLFNGIISLVIALNQNFEECHLYHVKQNLNSIIDHHDKGGTRLSKGEILVNGVGGSHVFP
jgi:hypothetical protein